MYQSRTRCLKVKPCLTAKPSNQLALECPHHTAFKRKARKGRAKAPKEFLREFGNIFATVAAKRFPRLSHRLLLQGLAGRQRAATNVVALQLAVEGRPADPQHFSGPRLVTLDLLKNTLDRVAFQLFQISI